MSGKDEALTGLWTPPANGSGLRAASNKWDEAIERVVIESFKVAYGGGIVTIDKGSTYYEDVKGRVLIGWHGTYNPPRDMAGYSAIEKD
ncbi:hypothetical protein [uncultured Enterococcus sp.]|uniref:hypothetical protein n=1 Tax=uncultured Enterococcus sp. TaxID=167972 RepID=UPI002AA7C6BD|nr:hypothetical protein [uncultured Enterococcus sp.]